MIKIYLIGRAKLWKMLLSNLMTTHTHTHIWQTLRFTVFVDASLWDGLNICAADKQLESSASQTEKMRISDYIYIYTHTHIDVYTQWHTDKAKVNKEGKSRAEADKGGQMQPLPPSPLLRSLFSYIYNIRVFVCIHVLTSSNSILSSSESCALSSSWSSRSNNSLGSLTSAICRCVFRHKRTLTQAQTEANTLLCLTFAMKFVAASAAALLKQYGNSPTDSATRVDSDGDEDELSWIAFYDFRFCFFFEQVRGNFLLPRRLFVY